MPREKPTREALVAAIEAAKRERDDARNAVDRAHASERHALVKYHEAQLALRRFDCPLPGEE